MVISTINLKLALNEYLHKNLLSNSSVNHRTYYVLIKLLIIDKVLQKIMFIGAVFLDSCNCAFFLKTYFPTGATVDTKHET